MEKAQARGEEQATSSPILQFSNIRKQFGQTLAVNDVSFDVLPGEIHALVGENGAGKSTLLKILSGGHTPDAGEIRISKEIVEIGRPDIAARLGIGVVHQIPTFVPDLSVTENLLLGFAHHRRKLGLIDWRAENDAARADLAKVGLQIDPRVAVSRLSPHERQLVAVARALRRPLKVLILDEVTAPLSEPEVKLLHDRIKPLRQSGVAIIYVSHRLDEIFKIADRVTVMRDGRHIKTAAPSSYSYDGLVADIVGFTPLKAPAKLTLNDDRTLTPTFIAKSLGDDKLKDVSFHINRGEILALCGLSGSGRSRLMHLIFGSMKKHQGAIEIQGKTFDIRSPKDGLSAGIGFVTEDRLHDGFIPDFPIWKNVSLPWASAFSRFGILNLKKEKRAAVTSATKIKVKMASPNLPMTSLSGGNQQKAIFARWTTEPIKLLLLDEPTHGVDIASKRQIYNLIRSMANNGISILMASSELEEVEELCDRAILLRDGSISTELRGPELTKDNILSALL